MSETSSSSPTERHARTALAFVELIDSLVDDFDVIDLLTVLTTRSVELLDVTAAGILLVDESDQLRVMAASTEQVGLLELFQIQNDDGPCLDCFRTGSIVIETDLAHSDRWPAFTGEALAHGFRSVVAVPLKLRRRRLGCLNLFGSDVPVLTPSDLALAQALADAASVAIAQDELIRAAAVREMQLQHALVSRVAIEQAKGMIAERLQVDMDDAFDRLRHYARQHGLKLSTVAADVALGRLALDVLLAPGH